MRQFILPEEWKGQSECHIQGGRARYLARVLRLGPGDSFPARDSHGKPWLCRVRESSPDSILLAVSEAEEGSFPRQLADARHGKSPRLFAEDGNPAVSAGNEACLPAIVLLMGLPKGAKMDLVVRQAAEAGVAAVLPLLSSRSASHGEETGSSRRSRWDRIVREALQQSGSSINTRICDPFSLEELDARLSEQGLGEDDPRILLHEAPLAQSSLHGYLSGAPRSVALCVGPEGGFSPDEVDFLVAEGFRPLHLAGAILRAETAALYAIAAAQIILSERSSWIPNSL